MAIYVTQNDRYGANRKMSPAAAGGAIALHVGVAIGIMMMPGVEIISLPPPGPIITENIPIPPPPDPVDIKDPAPTVKLRPVTAPKPVIETKTDAEFTVEDVKETDFPPFDPGPVRDAGQGEVFVPPVPPVITRATPAKRYLNDFQPPYPATQLRLGEEAVLTVRVTVGSDGRVRDIVLVTPVDKDFWDATRTQALRKWRFTPATRDGVPIESVREMVVRFEMN